MPSLTKTVPLISQYDKPLASQISSLAEAVDEVLTARFGGCSWLAFYPNVPNIELGKRFVFGTISNFPFIDNQYAATEDLPPPTEGQVLNYWSASKYVQVTGYSNEDSLNRRYVNWTAPFASYPSKWWLYYDSPERFERLAVADIIIQNYTDPIAGNNTTFTFKSTWDKHGCIRIHNANRFAITVNCQTGGSIEVPAYGIKCGRRISPTGVITWTNNYIHPTYVDDETTWDREYPGQTAGCMDQLNNIISLFYLFCRFNKTTDSDSTSREKASFTGDDPVGTDYFFDWLIHTGDILSVVTSKLDRTSSISTITWNGIGSGFASYSASVGLNYAIASDYISFSSTYNVNDFFHHLIPKSTNLITNIVDLSNGTHLLTPPYTPSWNHLQYPSVYGNFVSSSAVYYKPFANEENTKENVVYSWAPYNQQGYDYPSGWLAKLQEMFPAVTPVTGTSTLAQGYFKTSDAIGRMASMDLSSSAYMMSIDDYISQWCTFGSNSISQVGATNLGTLCSRRRFIPRQQRKYHDAGYIVGTAAIYDSHPQDSQVAGTTDGQAGDIQLINADIKESLLQIEGTDWRTYRPLEGIMTGLIGGGKGTWLHTPTTAFHYILSKIWTNLAWWYLNKNTYATTGNYELFTWRIPRLIEEFNDLAECVNNVVRVIPCGLEELYRDPLPLGYRAKPWSNYPEPTFEFPNTSREVCSGVPYDWLAGASDEAGVFAAWCSTWGLTPRTINISSYRNQDRMVWVNRKDSRVYPVIDMTASYTWGVSIFPHSTVDINYVNDDIVNGQYYPRRKALHSRYQERMLFGSAGSVTSYRYLTANDLDVVFDFIPNVPTGYREVGYRYTPVIETSTAVTKTVGNYYGDSAYNKPNYYDSWTDAQLFYKKPDSIGSWYEILSDGEACRLMDSTTGSNPLIINKQDNPTIIERPEEYLVHEMTFTDEAIRYGESQISNFYYGNNIASYATNKILPVEGSRQYQAWRHLPSITADYPIVIIASAEPYFIHTFVEIPLEYEFIAVKDIWTTITPDAVPVYIRKCSVADYPITVDKINSWTGQNLACWHVQIHKLSGVLRE